MAIDVRVHLQALSGETGLSGILRHFETGAKLNGASGDDLTEVLDEDDQPTGVFQMTVSESVSGIVVLVVAQDDAVVFTDQIDLDSTPRVAGNLLAHGDRVWASEKGSGAVEHVHLVTDPDAVPLANVEVWVTRTNDVDDEVLAGVLTTNVSGEVTFYLDPGSYYFWHSKSGYNFLDDPTIETVS